MVANMIRSNTSMSHDIIWTKMGADTIVTEALLSFNNLESFLSKVLKTSIYAIKIACSMCYNSS